MTRRGKEYAKFETDFQHDPRLRALTPAGRCWYYEYWLTAVKERCERLPPQFTMRYIAKQADVDPRCTRKAKDAIQKCTHDPLLIFHDDGSVTVCGVKDKHPELTAWKEYKPIDDGRTQEEPKTDEEAARELQEEMDKITPSKQEPVDWRRGRKKDSPYSIDQIALLECWGDNYREWRKGQERGPEEYTWGKWDAKNIMELLEKQDLDTAMTAVFYYRMFYKQAKMTVYHFATYLAEIVNTARSDQWQKCQKVVKEYREQNPERFQKK